MKLINILKEIKVSPKPQINWNKMIYCNTIYGGETIQFENSGLIYGAGYFMVDAGSHFILPGIGANKIIYLFSKKLFKDIKPSYKLSNSLIEFYKKSIKSGNYKIVK